MTWEQEQLSRLMNAARQNPDKITPADVKRILDLDPQKRDLEELYMLFVPTLRALQQKADPIMFDGGFKIARNQTFGAFIAGAYTHNHEQAVLVWRIVEYPDCAPFDGDPNRQALKFQAFTLYGHWYSGIHRGIVLFKYNGRGLLFPGNGITLPELRAMSDEDAMHHAVILNEDEAVPIGMPSALEIIRTTGYRKNEADYYTLIHVDRFWPITHAERLRAVPGTILPQSRMMLYQEFEAFMFKVMGVMKDMAPFPQQRKDTIRITHDRNDQGEGPFMFIPRSDLRESAFCSTIRPPASIDFPDYATADERRYQIYDARVSRAAAYDASMDIDSETHSDTTPCKDDSLDSSISPANGNEQQPREAAGPSGPRTQLANTLGCLNFDGAAATTRAAQKLPGAETESLDKGTYPAANGSGVSPPAPADSGCEPLISVSNDSGYGSDDSSAVPSYSSKTLKYDKDHKMPPIYLDNEEVVDALNDTYCESGLQYIFDPEKTLEKDKSTWYQRTSTKRDEDEVDDLFDEFDGLRS